MGKCKWPWWARLLPLLAVGCGANFLQPPKGPAQAVPKGQPYLNLVVSGVDLERMGLYLAPNVVPALEPDFNAKAQIRPPVVAAAEDTPIVPGKPEADSWLERILKDAAATAGGGQ